MDAGLDRRFSSVGADRRSASGDRGGESAVRRRARQRAPSERHGGRSGGDQQAAGDAAGVRAGDPGRFQRRRGGGRGGGGRRRSVRQRLRRGRRAAARRPLGGEGDHLEPFESRVAAHGRVVRYHDREAGAGRQLRDQGGRPDHGAGRCARVRAARREDDRRRAMNRRAGLLLVAALLAGHDVAAQADSGAARPSVLVRAGRLIAVRTGTVLTNQAILIEGDRIKEVGPADAVAGHAPRDARVIDLRNATVLPGLIDCHTHITSDPGDYYKQLFRMSPIDEAVRAHLYAKRTLDAGFTTVRNVGAGEFIDVALRNAINEGAILGPRMLVSTMPLSATGGHGDVNGMSPYLRFDGFSGIANGVDQIREKIRFEVKYGADLIKVLASAGVLSEEESVGAPQYSQEELNAIVEEAAMWGRKVAAHAHGAEAIKRAVRAGVASVEHGSLIDDEGIRLMKERGTYLVADIYNDDYILAEYTRLGYPQKIIDKERQVGRLQRENFKKAVQAGVRMACGSDAGVYPHGWNAKQFAHMVRWGTTPLQAIQAATVNAADLLGWRDLVGALEPGKFADVIGVMGDPLQDVTVLEHVGLVMKGGQIVKASLTGGAK